MPSKAFEFFFQYIIFLLQLHYIACIDITFVNLEAQYKHTCILLTFYYTFKQWTCLPTVNGTSACKLSQRKFQEKYWKCHKYDTYNKRYQKSTYKRVRKLIKAIGAMSVSSTQTNDYFPLS